MGSGRGYGFGAVSLTLVALGYSGLKVVEFGWSYNINWPALIGVVYGPITERNYLDASYLVEIGAY